MKAGVAPAILLALFLPACTGLGEVPAALRSSDVGSATRESNTPDDTVSLIYSFRGLDGSTPEAAVIADAQGNLYGTTSTGGAPIWSCSGGCGTAFELISQKGSGWKERVLHSFSNSSSVLYPSNPLVFDSLGNLYSATDVGGTYGVVYGLLRNGRRWSYAQLYAFSRRSRRTRSALGVDLR